MKQTISSRHRDYRIEHANYQIPDNVCINGNVEYYQENIDRLFTYFKLVIRHILEPYCPNEWWIVGGSLLGVIRQGSLLPWDDDCDFAISKIAFDNILVNLSTINNSRFARGGKNEKNSFTIAEYFCGFKIYGADGFCVADLFLVEELELKSKTKTNVSFTNYNERRLIYSGKSLMCHTFPFPQISFLSTDVFPLKKMHIMGITVNIPQKPKTILYNNYSNTCLKTIKLPNILSGIHKSYINHISSQWLFFFILRLYNSNKYPNLTNLAHSFFPMFFKYLFVFDDLNMHHLFKQSAHVFIPMMECMNSEELHTMLSENYLDFEKIIRDVVIFNIENPQCLVHPLLITQLETELRKKIN